MTDRAQDRFKAAGPTFNTQNTAVIGYTFLHSGNSCSCIEAVIIAKLCSTGPLQATKCSHMHIRWQGYYRPLQWGHTELSQQRWIPFTFCCGQGLSTEPSQALLFSKSELFYIPAG